jgi:hypothetical protein
MEVEVTMLVLLNMLRNGNKTYEIGIITTFEE